VAELCDALAAAAQGGALERVHVHLIDWTTYEVFGRRNRALGVGLMRGLGLLYCTQASISMVGVRVCEDLEWAMQQPGRTMPLAWLHGELEVFLNKHDPGDQGGDQSQVENTKAFFLRKSSEAADQLNGDLFFSNFEAALDSVGKTEAEVKILRGLRYGEDFACISDPPSGTTIMRGTSTFLL
jgi:hypothetical protein